MFQHCFIHQIQQASEVFLKFTSLFLVLSRSSSSSSILLISSRSSSRSVHTNQRQTERKKIQKNMTTTCGIHVALNLHLSSILNSMLVETTGQQEALHHISWQALSTHRCDNRAENFNYFNLLTLTINCHSKDRTVEQTDFYVQIHKY